MILRQLALRFFLVCRVTSKYNLWRSAIHFQYLVVIYKDTDIPPWPQVNREDIMTLISKLKASQASGPDGRPAKLFKKYADWLAPLLATLFILIDHYDILQSHGKTHF